MIDTLALSALQAALVDLQKDAGSKADASVTIHANRIQAYFRPNGWGSEQPFILGEGDTPEACIAAARTKWEEMRERVRSETVKKLALAIIRITHEAGCCTDAALRAEFETGEIECHSEAALMMANQMAENGPFKIMELAGANAA